MVVIGAGPAGLACALYACRAELETVVLERSYPGGQVALTDRIDNYPGFPEGVAGPELVERMVDQVKRFGAEIRTEEVTEIIPTDEYRIVRTSSGEYECGVVVVACGADPRKLGVPGEEEFRGRGVSYCGTCDAPFFAGKKVVVVGGGDAALKEALYIVRFATEVVLVHRRQGFRAEKIYQVQVRENERIRLRLDSVVEEILGSEKVEAVRIRNVKNGQVDEMKCDGVFIFIGHRPNTDFLKGVVEMDENGLIKTDENMTTSVPGVYAVGDVRSGSRRQVATAVGEGVTAAMAADHWLTEAGWER